MWARWDGRTVHIFNHRLKQIALHARHEPGPFAHMGTKVSGSWFPCAEHVLPCGNA
jgi:hypothetical protein